MKAIVRLWIVGLVFSIIQPSFAWSAKEHIMLTRMAARSLMDDPATPVEMKTWLAPALAEVGDQSAEEQFFMTRKVGKNPEGYTGLLKYAYQPDIHQFGDPRDSRVAPFDVHEKLLHFIDLELFITGDTKRGYRDDLSNRPPLEAIPRVMSDERFKQAGMLPFRVEYCYGKLVDAIRAGRLNGSEQLLEAEEDSATRWAGYIAHYLEDNTQPHHSTIDYKSQSYFKIPRKSPNAHNEIEFRMVDDEVEEFPELRREYWALFMQALENAHDPIETDDLFVATLQVAMRSYEALPLIGAAAVHAHVPVEGNKADKIDTVKFFRYEGTLHGRKTSVMQMKAHQQAWAVKRVARVWRAAWTEATGTEATGR